MLNFDSRGNLTPNTNIKCTLQIFHEVFVKDLPNPKRIVLYKSFLKYTSELKEKLDGSEIVCWINGSYTTKKGS